MELLRAQGVVRPLLRCSTPGSVHAVWHSSVRATTASAAPKAPPVEIGCELPPQIQSSSFDDVPLERKSTWIAAGAAVCGCVTPALLRRAGRRTQRGASRHRGRTFTVPCFAVAERTTASDATTPPEAAAGAEWPAERVRQEFVDYFTRQQKHIFVPSSPVVPLNDPTLLFANAGMNQFKAIFLGQLEPNSPLQGVTRAANSQKCIRAGGKHNDLDDVGHDCYHHTFFEMMGNWSFGDYFKEEAIDWAWDLLTSVYGLEPERLYASYFAGDEDLGLPADLEAKELWERYLPATRVLPFGKGDNFWEMGAVGPCGPCSELHYDRIGGRDAAGLVNMDDPDVVEIWNLVFMQFYRDDAGKLTTLPNQHIDTGMGLERVASILQRVRSNYDTDLFTPLLDAVHRHVGGEVYGGRLGEADEGLRDTAYRVIVDHARTLTLAVGDGAVPSNEGRGYVLRRILRRAVRYGRQMLGAPPGFFSKLVPEVIKSLEGAYPELSEGADRIVKVLSEEEVAFDKTVERGMQYFTDLRVELAASGLKVVPGERAFLLYNSHGFPVDLTQQMAEEASLTVDMAGFEAAMEKQKEVSRSAMREQQALQKGMSSLELVAEQTAWLEQRDVVPTEDSQKYEWDVRPVASVKAIFTESGFVVDTSGIPEGARVGLILNRTPFYAEAGGQVGDVGELCSSTGSFALPIVEVKVYGGYVLHSGLWAAGAETVSVGDEVTCAVDYEHRRRVAPNHTMTHALNWALRNVLGDGVQQRGSLVNADRLRFDFSADTVKAADLKRVEKLVAEVVDGELSVTTQEVPLPAAMGIAGVQAVAGEAYPDPVRVVTMGAPIEDVLASPTDERWRSQSVEFCGGTHISNTSEAGAFVVLEERSIAKGVHRIIAATGGAARQAIQDGEQVVKRLEKLEVGKGGQEAAVLEFSQHLDVAVLPAVLKLECRNRIDKLRKKIKKEQQKGKGSTKEVKDAIETVSAAAELAIMRESQYCIVRLAGVDGKALQQVFADPPGDVAVLAYAVGPGGGLSCIAVVPQQLQAEGRGADAWIRAVLEPLNGRGGGKPGKAQGSAPAATEGSEFQSALEVAAWDFWAAAK